MKVATLREQTEEELRHLVRETTRHLTEMHARQGMGEGSEHPIRARELRRVLARIKTVMRERGIQEND